VLKDTVTYTGALPPSACGTRRAESSSTPLPTCRRALPSQDRHRGEADSKRLPHPPLLPQTRLTPALCASIADGRRVRVRRHPANRTSATLRRHRRMALSSPPTFDALQAASSRPRALRLRWLRPRAPRLKDGAPLGPPYTALPLPSRPVHETGVIAWELLAVPCAERRKFLTGALPGEVQ
jgi:hypothetical protein